jgi:hypothetical protein
MTCHQQLPKTERTQHQCRMRLPAQDVQTDEEMKQKLLYVYDLECYQEEVKPGLYKHVCNLVCMRSVYGDYATTFLDIESFMQHLLIAERFEGSTFIAHNGGAYDMQFITQYLDKNGMLYNTIPRPGSQHKYLSLAINRRGRKNIVFKDTLMFIPGSLKNLGKDFGCSVTK